MYNDVGGNINVQGTMLMTSRYWVPRQQAQVYRALGIDQMLKFWAQHQALYQSAMSQSAMSQSETDQSETDLGQRTKDKSLKVKTIKRTIFMEHISSKPRLCFKKFSYASDFSQAAVEYYRFDLHHFFNKQAIFFALRGKKVFFLDDKLNTWENYPATPEEIRDLKGIRVTSPLEILILTGAGELNRK